METEIQALPAGLEHVGTVSDWLAQQWGAQSGRDAGQMQRRLLQTPDCPASLLALRRGEPVGVLGFARFQRPHELKPSLFVDSLLVNPPNRGTGVGTLLLRRAIADARSLEKVLYVYTNVPDFYRTRGFHLIEVAPDSDANVLACPLD